MGETTNPSPRKKPSPIDYGKFAGMGFQMAAIIGLGTFAGIKLDQFLGFKKFPAFTLSFALLSVFGAMYFFIKEVMNKK